ncbi:glycine--tRNA ligase, partial [Candidatus Curtissbacteria bacterium]|nr:glycine--tRNA ligase [Candidatus Curtissbacteria bacterium]
MARDKLIEKIVSLTKRRGFIFPGSEIYGGLSGIWDWGPLGVELKNNIKRAWWKSVVYDRDDVFGLDSSILMNAGVWKASGHVDGFIDMMVDCKSCKRRFRADHVDGKKCPECKGELTASRPFNLMMETSVGPMQNTASRTYLRPETAQGIFTNYLNIVNTFHPEFPFGIAQIGKAFRNVEKGTEKKWFGYWQEARLKWYTSLGINKKKLRLRQHQRQELAHYALQAADIEYEFNFGESTYAELEGIANRTDFDLKNHAKHSGIKLDTYPFVIEPSAGVDRSALTFLLDAYYQDKERTILKLHPQLAPYKVAVFPLLANKPDLVKKAKEVLRLLTGDYRLQPVAWDDRGNIGKRYWAQDEIGTPWCITCDFQTLEDDTVTIRDRDTTKQERVKVAKLE